MNTITKGYSDNSIYILSNEYISEDIAEEHLEQDELENSDFIEFDTAVANHYGYKHCAIFHRNDVLCIKRLDTNNTIVEGLFSSVKEAIEKNRNKSFYGVGLSGADLTNMCFFLMDFSSADLSNTDLTGAYLEEADFSFTNFKNAKLPNVDLRKTKLEYADFTNADLRCADFTDVNLTGVDFTNTNLDESCLDWTNLSYVTGNQKEIKNIYLPDHHITYSNHMLYIGKNGLHISQWNVIAFDEIERMKNVTLDWWSEHGENILKIIKDNPAI